MVVFTENSQVLQTNMVNVYIKLEVTPCTGVDMGAARLFASCFGTEQLMNSWIQKNKKVS